MTSMNSAIPAVLWPRCRILEVSEIDDGETIGCLG